MASGGGSKRAKMADIERVVYEALLRGGAPQPERFTKIVAENIRREYGGSEIYVDHGKPSRNQAIAESVRNGASEKQVAEKYNLSVSQVKRIARGWK